MLLPFDIDLSKRTIKKGEETLYSVTSFPDWMYILKVFTERKIVEGIIVRVDLVRAKRFLERHGFTIRKLKGQDNYAVASF